MRIGQYVSLKTRPNELLGYIGTVYTNSKVRVVTRSNGAQTYSINELELAPKEIRTRKKKEEIR